MSDKQDKSAEHALAEEANREAWRESIFWNVDHPSDAKVERGRKPDRPTTTQTLLDGVRQSIAAAERMLKVAKQRMALAGQLSGQAADRVPSPLRAYMATAVMGVLKADLGRARSELLHWHEYARFYEGQAAGKVERLDRDTSFTPPWLGEQLNIEAERAF